MDLLKTKRIAVMTMLLWAETLALSSGVSAAVILQDRATAAPTFVEDGPHTTFAQSFTAEDSVVSSIGFAITDANAFLGGLTFTVTLFLGEGTGGPALASVTRTFASLPPIDFVQLNFVDFDFSTVPLAPGQVYTAKMESASGRGQTYESYFWGDVYPGGLAYRNDIPFLAPTGHLSDVGLEDLVFRVLPVLKPTITSLTAMPSVIWPPNHKMVPVSVAASVSDSSSVTPSCQISAVSSNELFIVPGQMDWAVIQPLTVNLRAERAGSGKGRVYTLTVTCTNASNLSDSKSVTVSVPHDQGK